MAPFAQAELQHAGQNDQVILLGMDQTDLGGRMAVLMITLRVGGRSSLPLRGWQKKARLTSASPSRKYCWTAC
jgi:hypothetical protein